MDRKKLLIKTLGLKKHPEGGYFKESYRSQEMLTALPKRFSSEKRNISTAIYYLLGSLEHSNFHRIKSDEIWHHYEGDPITLYIIEKKELKIKKLGLININANNTAISPQIVVGHESWFAAESSGPQGYSLVGCTVAPGFDFTDFEMAERTQLIQAFPKFSKVIERFSSL